MISMDDIKHVCNMKTTNNQCIPEAQRTSIPEDTLNSLIKKLAARGHWVAWSSKLAPGLLPM